MTLVFVCKRKPEWSSKVCGGRRFIETEGNLIHLNCLNCGDLKTYDRETDSGGKWLRQKVLLS